MKKTKKKNQQEEKKLMKKREKNSELTGLTLQTKLTRQILDSCRESLITK